MSDGLYEFLSIGSDPRIGALASVAEPALLFAEGGERVVWANAAGTRLLGERRFRDVTERSFSPRQPFVRQVADLMAALHEGAMPRLAMLRLSSGLNVVAQAFLCRTLRLDTGLLVLLAEPAARSRPDPAIARDGLVQLFPERDLAVEHAPGSPDSAWRPLGEVYIRLPDDLSAGREPQKPEIDEPPDEGPGIGEPPPERPEDTPPEIDEPQDPRAPDPPPEAPPVEDPEHASGEANGPKERFSWHSDAAGRIVFASPAAAAAFGAEPGGIEGEALLDLVARAGGDGTRLGTALAGQDSFSGVGVTFPRGGDALHVAFSALPVFEAGGRFAGFRGFALAQKIKAAPPAASSPVSEEAEATVLPFRPHLREAPGEDGTTGLAQHERDAFREIARALGARAADDGPAVQADEETGPLPPSGPAPAEPPAATDYMRLMGRGLVPPTAFPAPEPEPRNTAPVAAEPAPGLVPSAFAGGATAETLVDLLPVPTVVFRDERLVFVNRAALELVGRPSLAALEAAGGLGALFADASGEPLARAADLSAGPVAVVHAEGHRIGVDARLFCAPWRGRSALVFVLRPGDTKSPRLKAALASIEELRAILDTATDGVVVLAGDGRIESINRSAEALFGYEAGEVLEEPFTMLLAEESRTVALDYIEGLMRNGVASVMNDGREVVGRVRQGGTIPLFLTIGRIGEPDARRFCAVLRDISHWKSAEKDLTAAKVEAERTSAHKTDFLAKISHEVRTPLNAILGFSEVILEERFGPIGNERYRGYLRDIHTSGSHVISLVNDLLDLSKIEAGRLELAFAGVALNDVAQQCVAIMQPQANRERILIRTSLSSAVPQIVADQRSLRQIVLNLLSNSVRFTRPGGQVIVSTAYTEHGEVTLRVRDTGIGMSENQIEAALEPFRQIGASSALANGGTGLGLPLTKALAEANRAAFVIRSSPDSGTMVEITFPAARVLTG